MKETKFDEIISLGYNCEVSFRIIDYYGEVNSYPYSWAYICDRSLFLKSLSNLDDLLTGNITLLPWGMFKCEKYNIHFHSSTEKDYLFIDGKPNDKNVKIEITNLKNKTKHLVIKFKDLFQTEKSTLFVLKLKHDKHVSDICFVEKLYLKLSECYKSKKFILLVVLEEKHLTDELLKLESDYIKIRSVKYFAKDNDTLTGGDLRGWYTIFDELK